MTERIFRYLREQQPETPCLVDRPRRGRAQLPPHARALPAAHIFYAVKASPAAQILARLATAGSSSTHREPRRDRDGAGHRHRHADRISFGNTIKGRKGHRLGLSAGRAPVRLRQARPSCRSSPAWHRARACSAVCWSIAAAPSGRSAKFGCAPRWPRTCC
jgi:ornithine decarboxylase